VSYHIYTTEGLVLSHRSRREADRIYSILTRDFGLVRANATSVRKETSKLRASLEPLSFSTVSFIKGKEYWKIVNAQISTSLSDELRDKKEMFTAFSRVFSLLEKLVAGESRHPELLDHIEHVTKFALENDATREEVGALEIILITRILAELGYVSSVGLPVSVLSGPIQASSIVDARANNKQLLGAINKGIEMSSLG
jgi:DNA repair protein RecO